MFSAVEIRNFKFHFQLVGLCGYCMYNVEVYQYKSWGKAFPVGLIFT